MLRRGPRPSGYKPSPWPWAYPSVLKPFDQPSWLNEIWSEVDESSTYSPPYESSHPFSFRYYSSSSESDSDSDSDSAERHSQSSDESDLHISASEISELQEHAIAWRGPNWPTRMQIFQEEMDSLPLDIAKLVKLEEDATAAYDPAQVVSLITQFLELLIEMGHYPEGSLRYAPHINFNVELATQLGYTADAIAIMQQLPYLKTEVNHDPSRCILKNMRFMDYTLDDDIREGRRPHPYLHSDNYANLDPWMIPLMRQLPGEPNGCHVILDTKMGVVRAYGCNGPLQHTVEWRRHGPRLYDGQDVTDARRACLVRAADYFSELIYAYRSLSRLAIIDAQHSNLWENQFDFAEKSILQDKLLALYGDCGWPDEWRRAEFLSKWETALETTRWLEAKAKKLVAIAFETAA